MSGLSRDDFIRDTKTKDAACMRIIAIAESAKRYLDTVPDAGSTPVPWRELAAMRNRIAHDYGGVDYAIVWEVCTRDIPVLEELISQLAPSSRSEPGTSS
jgi:uncharacterized protein with HEPN domain